MGRHPILDGPPTRRPRSGGAVALLAVLAVVMVVWVVSGGDPGTATRTDDRYVDTGAPTATPVPSATATSSAASDAAADPASAPVDPVSGLPLVALAGLPPEAQAAVAQVTGGGTLPAGSVARPFPNRVGKLPAAAPGYYCAYTPPTVAAPEGQVAPQVLVVGGGGELYWTADRTTFVAIQV